MKKQTSVILPVVLVVVAALAFAGWRMWGTQQGVAGNWPALDGGVYAESVSSGGLKYLVPPDEIYDSGLEPEDRPVLNDPKLDDVITADAKLADDLEGIAVTVGGQQRFYAFQILNWHQLIRDEINGEQLWITYSPLTGSAVVYSAHADRTTGEMHGFVDSGKVYNNALLLADNHGTLWNQTTGQAIAGEEVGQRLEIYPSMVMSWAVWKDLNPSGLALSTDTGYDRDYGRHPYASYETSPGIFFPLNHTFTKMEPKDLVYRVEPMNEGDQPVVFLGRYLPGQENANVDLGLAGETGIIAFYDEDQDVVRAFTRMQGSRTLTFEQKGSVITDKETGSRWSPEGVAVAGELRGEVLQELSLTRHYAFAHFAMYPQSIISGEELLPTEELPVEGEILEIN
ncbi:MAG: DUF3179 domain-containing (seleno)protein [Patescibacteria group bacterium]